MIVTTATAPIGSAAARLRHPRAHESDEATALQILEDIAQSSINQDTKEGREAFLALPPQSRKNLLRSIHVRDQSPTITDVRQEIEDRLAFAAPLHHVPSLVDHLEGWWFAQIVICLSNPSGQSISLLALRKKIDEIANAFKSGDLLISEEAPQIPDAVLIASDSRLFVKQMRCVGLAEQSIELAKRDYYRATAQRSAWARENVLLDGETHRYDAELVDRWDRERLAREAAAKPASDDEKEKFGREIFHWANREQMPFRNRHETWLCSGSYQILADALEVGWHPDHLSLFASSHDEAA